MYVSIYTTNYIVYTIILYYTLYTLYILYALYSNRYNSSVVWESGNISATKISTQYVPFRKYSQGELQVDAVKAVDAMDGLRRICSDMSQPVFPWTNEYTRFETLK